MRILAVIFLLTSCSSLHLVNDGKTGSYTFTGPALSKDKPVKVHYFIPSGVNEKSRVFFTMHGVNRNAKKYLDAWIEYAEKENMVLVAPEFSKDFYKGSNLYNLGNMKSVAETTSKKPMWTFHIIDRIFEDVKVKFNIQTTSYDIYGHSAGAQFVHRLVMYCPNAKIHRAYAANAGWYSFPTNESFPYGMGARYSKNLLTSAFSKNLYILLGDKDVNPASKRMRNTDQAEEQGENRFERGKNFLETARNIAQSMDIDFKWKLRIIPNTAHNNQKIATYIANLDKL